jgi:Glyoxalase-like domain
VPLRCAQRIEPSSRGKCGRACLVRFEPSGDVVTVERSVRALMCCAEYNPVLGQVRTHDVCEFPTAEFANWWLPYPDVHWIAFRGNLSALGFGLLGGAGSALGVLLGRGGNAPGAGHSTCTPPAQQADILPRRQGFPVYFLKVPEPKVGKNRFHLDLVTDGSMPEEVDRLVKLGARVIDVRRDDPESHVNPDTWTVLEDLEGNVFCVTSSTTLSGWT